MKTKKSFGEFILNVWTAILRVLFPRYCVKSLTLKTRRNASRYLLGAEKELAYIDKFHLSDKEIADRVWSYETKVTLLERGCPTLINEIRTLREFEAIYRTHVEEHIIAAMRVYTPPRTVMCSIRQENNRDFLCSIAKHVPTAFDTLTAEEIWGKRELQYDKLAIELAKSNPQRALQFMLLLREIVPSQLSTTDTVLMKELFFIALKGKQDISEMIAYLYVFFPELYACVRDSFASYKYFTACYKVMFPQFVQHLSKEANISCMKDICIEGEVGSNVDEAYKWLRIGFKRLPEEEIFSILLSLLGTIRKKISASLYEQLFFHMVDNAISFSDLRKLYYLVEEPHQCYLANRLVASLERGQDGATLVFAFPFTGWDEELQERAVVAMAEKRELPVERLGELSAKLQGVALAELEAQSQIAALHDIDLVVKLIKTTKLYPKAEIAFLSMEPFDASLKEDYIKRFQLDMETFCWLISVHAWLNYTCKVSFLKAYAQQWGLTPEQYQRIMQTPLAAQAPFLKRYVKQD